VRRPLAAALNGIGVLHFNGWGVPVNYSLAATFFKAAGIGGTLMRSLIWGRCTTMGWVCWPTHQELWIDFQRAMDEGHWQVSSAPVIRTCYNGILLRVFFFITVLFVYSIYVFELTLLLFLFLSRRATAAAASNSRACAL